MSGAEKLISSSTRSMMVCRRRAPMFSVDSFTRDIRTVATFAAGDLVDFIEEHNPRLLDSLDCRARNLIHVNETLLFFLDQILEGFAHLHLPLLGALAEDVGQHVLDVDVHLL